MDPGSFFVLTELGVGIAGFSAIVVAIGLRSNELEPISRYRVLSLLLSALLAAFGSLVPQLLAGLDFVDESLWRWSSIILAVSIVASAVDSELRRYRLSPIERAKIASLLYVSLMANMVGLTVWLVANATNASPSAGPAFGSLALLLLGSAIVFVRFLVAPRGRSPSA